MLKTAKFAKGDKVDHPYFGAGVVREVYALGVVGTDQENEYTVKLRGERYPATLGEESLSLR